MGDKQREAMHEVVQMATALHVFALRLKEGGPITFTEENGTVRATQGDRDWTARGLENLILSMADLI